MTSFRLLRFTALLVPAAMSAQTPFSGNYAQDFSELQLGAVNATFAWSDNTTLPGWYFGLRGSGSSYITPTVYTTKITNANVSASPGPISPAYATGAADRALGLQTSTGTSVTSSSVPMAIGLRLTNTTGSVISSINLSFTAEQWSRGYSSSARNEKLAFSYSTTASGLSLIAGNTFTDVPSLLFTSPQPTQTAESGTTYGLDGNADVNRTVFAAITVPIAGGWAPGADLWLRWSVPEDLPSGSRGGIIAIDDLAITTTAAAGSPAIVTPPTSQNVAAGDAVTFSVVASGDPVLTYQWRKNGDPIPDAHEASYTIPGAATADAGRYDVVVANDLGSTTSAYATLTVAGPAGAPLISTPPASQSAVLGATVTFTVTATGDPELVYQWRKDDVPIPEANASSLVLANIDATSAGDYTVVVSNDLGSVTSDPATLIVSGSAIAPDITTQPVAASVTSGATATFTVAATGTPAPTLQWRKNGNPIPNATNATLTLPNVSPADAAGYDVVLANSAGSVTSYRVTLTVDGQLGPVLYYQPVSHQIATGASVTFRVVAVGMPALEYQWRRGGVPLPGATAADLTVSSATAADIGPYDVIVSNSLGSVTSAAASLDVVDVSPGSVLLVDQRPDSTTPYKTIAAAAAAVKAGDTIELVPGSGPYRETIYLTTSGTEAAPIVFEGNHELVTGYVPFQFTQQSDGSWTYTLPAPLAQTLPGGNSNTFRHLITYRGQRLLADQVAGTQGTIRFTTDWCILSADGLSLILNTTSGASPTDGWEIGGNLAYGVRLAGTTAHHVYRHLRVTGMSDDGFNIHGSASDIRFEDIEGFNNFDEGYSAHDATQTTIQGGAFWGNDNGLYNQTRDTVVCIADDVKSFSNVGLGFGAKAGLNVFSNIEVWDNGVQNFTVGGMAVLHHVVTYRNRWTTRPWVAFQESQNFTIAGKQAGDYASVLYTNVNFGPLVVSAETPGIREATQLPPLLLGSADWRQFAFTPTQRADPTISGWDADPDRDGLPNLLEYAFGLDPLVPDRSPVNLGLADGGPVLMYPKRRYNTDVALAVDTAPDLAAGWTNDDPAVEFVALPGDETPASGFETIAAARPPATDENRRFLRLRAVAP